MVADQLLISCLRIRLACGRQRPYLRMGGTLGDALLPASWQALEGRQQGLRGCLQGAAHVSSLNAGCSERCLRPIDTCCLQSGDSKNFRHGSNKLAGVLPSLH